MRLPKRRSQLLHITEDTTDGDHVTPQGIQRLEADLHRLETVERPQAIRDVTETVAKGDLRENAEYQEARARLSRIDSRIFSLKDRLKRVIPIHADHQSETVQLGSTVVIASNGVQKTFHIVGPRETNPTQGRISHVSPLGAALIGHSVGEIIHFQTPDRDVTYQIIEIK